MSRSYYYLISSLPLLRWANPPSMSSDEFLAQCEEQVPADVLADLRDVSLIPRAELAPSDAETRWVEWDGYIRNQLVHTRAAHLRQEAAHMLRDEPGAFPTDRKELDEILPSDDPLERERALDHMRWRRLEGMESGHPFDRDRLVIYRLKLLLLEKWARFDGDTGSRNLADLVDVGLRQASERRITTE
ncbi:MAG: DUF2764 family protein [Victivallales bacterium]|jgi:hypothetical protein|nr:DUF2764 family protein [Victivallales bacterium]MBT7165254.1 DUF2764 family protein [Victivallales bacterium]